MSTTAADVYTSTVTVDGVSVLGIDDDGIPFPQGTTGTKDISTQDSGTVMDKGLKRYEPGSISMTGKRMPADTGQNALLAAVDARTAVAMSVTTAGETFTYDAYVTEFNVDTKDGTLTFAAKLQMIGKAPAGYVVSADYPDAPTFVFNPAGTNVPTTIGTDNNVVNSQANGVSSVTLAITQASATGIAYSYDEMITWYNMRTGVASSSIPLGAVSSVTIVWVKIEQTGKATRLIKFLVTRAA